MEFVHLHVHSHYSLLDGASRVGDLIGRAVEHGMKSLALTDHGNMFGQIEFYKKATAAGVKPILGIEAYISPTTRHDRSMGGIESAAYHLLLLATNVSGWKNLLRLSSRSYLEGFYYRPRVDRELLSQFNEGLLCTSACIGGEIPSALLQGQEERARKIAGEYLDIFGRERFFIEMQNHGYEEQARVNPDLVKLAKHLNVRLVGTNDVHFLRPEDKVTHEILTCISTGKTLSDEGRMRYSPELYMKSGAEMCRAMSEWPEAAANTLSIAEMCDCKPDYSRKLMPVFHAPGGKPPDVHLSEIAWDGLRKRFDGAEPPPEYRARLEWELKVIIDKGYGSYFLIVDDCVRFARGAGIPASPRGSGVATLLGYALRLSEVDPLRYGLLFERFTDPQRKEDPDIDLDICQEGRGRVIQYVREKYGNVAQIITYGTLKARAAIRDVGRVMGIPLGEVDVIAKLVPEGPEVTLEKALDGDPDLRRLYDSEERVKTLIDHSMKLEGLVRHSGVHAAGIVICDRPLDDLLPLCKQADSVDVITQWDGPTCDKIGMMKMDFLGLRTLTILQRTRDLVRQRTGRDIDPDSLQLDDEEVFQLFREGKTDGIFQFESDGMKSVLVQMQPNRIEDLIAANAMYRPGPMRLIQTYCARKGGKEPVPRIHPLADDVLSETYGIMVYQEQVMQVLNRLGKLPLNGALTLIKAISKKRKEVIDGERATFARGATENGIGEAEIKRLFDHILEFGGYGFNKAHSTRYAIVAYQTAYFKVHYPREFVTATLTFESGDRDKVVQYMTEAGRMGISIAPPDINKCTGDFVVDGDVVRFGLAAVKGVGAKAVEAIVEERNRVGRFRDLFHFCGHVDLRAVNRSAIEALIKSGSFDSAGGSHRAALLEALDAAMAAGQARAADKKRGQIGLFETSAEEEAITARFPDVEPWSRKQILDAERETLGFYVTAHPLDRYQRLLDNLNLPRRFSLSEADGCQDGTRIACGCMVAHARTVVTKKGKSAGQKMAILTLEDVTGKCEAVAFPETFERLGSTIAVNSFVYVTGSISRRNERLGIMLDTAIPIESAVGSTTVCVTVRLSGASADGAAAMRLRDVAQRHSGNCPLKIHVKPDENARETVVIEPHKRWFVKPSLELVKEIEDIVGPKNLFLSPRQPQGRAEGRKPFQRAAASG